MENVIKKDDSGAPRRRKTRFLISHVERTSISNRKRQ